MESLQNPHRAPGRIGVCFFGRQCPGAQNVVLGVFDFLKERAPGGELQSCAQRREIYRFAC